MYITNKTEFNYKLNIHAATMLMHGINIYYKNIRRIYKNKVEDNDYCDLMLWTAKEETERLLRWFIKVKDRKSPLGIGLVDIQIKDLNWLLRKIERFRNKLRDVG